VVSQKCFRCVILLISVIVFSCINLYGQGVAVVLSGGGSRGMAHIGVLKALEENNIPVDYITGTSIGAVIGALYAAGYSPAEIEAVFLNERFDRWINREKEYRKKYFYTQDNPDAGWVDLKLDFKNRYSKILPPKVWNPSELNFELTRMFASASAAANYNFDSLMIPFRCIAADIDSNRTVVLRHGSLANAVRATITFPFLFKPIEIDGSLLFDGGMYNNFPTDVAMSNFAPTLIIGSKVSGNYPKPDPDDILSQIQNMLMTNTDFSLDTTSGVLIEPSVKKVSLIDFSMSEEFIDIGYRETLEKMEEIKRKVPGRRSAETIQEMRLLFNQKKPAYFIDSIFLHGLDQREQKYVYKTLIHKSKQLSMDELEPFYYRLAADNQLSLGKIELKYDASKKYYDLSLTMKPANRFKIKFGGNISSRLANQAMVELNYRELFQDALKLKFNVYFGRFYTSALLGGRIDFPGKVPFYAGGSIVYNHYDYFKGTIHFIEDVTPSFLIQNGNYVNFYAGIPTNITGKFEAGITAGLNDDSYYQDNIFSREDTADITKFNFIKTGLLWELNSLNRKQYASSGARFRIKTGIVTGDEEFISGSKSNLLMQNPKKNHNHLYFDLLWDNYFSKLGQVKFGFYGRLRLSNQQFFSNYTSSLLAAPAFEPVPESKTVFLANYRAFNYGAAGLKLVWEFAKNLDFRGETYLFQPHRHIMRGEDNIAVFGEEFSHRYWMFSGAVVYHTFFGPISFSVNYFENPEEKFFAALNIGFLIFNPRALD
jgi:NTE family protein